MLTGFCHISEYGSQGYRRLRPMVAVSRNLTLWAPSTALLNSTNVPRKQFLTLVESGNIRIIARENWLLSRSSRDQHPWEKAAWVPSVDDRIRQLALDGFEGVRVAPPERGGEEAERIADEDPSSAEELYKAYTSRDPTFDIPLGVRQAAERAGETPSAVVRAILRDIVNHADAFRESGAERPFFLTRNPRTEFTRRVVEVLGKSHQEEEPLPSLREREADLARESEIAEQLFELVAHMDSVGSGNLVSFVNGPGHFELSKWYSRLLADIQLDGSTKLDGIVARKLLDDITRHRPGGVRENVVISALQHGADIAGLATAVVGYIIDPSGFLSLVGLGTSAVSSSIGTLKALGMIPPSYEGTQWPFFYTFGSRATARRHAQIKWIVDELRKP